MTTRHMLQHINAARDTPALRYARRCLCNVYGKRAFCKHVCVDLIQRGIMLPPLLFTADDDDGVFACGGGARAGRPLLHHPGQFRKREEGPAQREQGSAVSCRKRQRAASTQQSPHTGGKRQRAKPSVKNKRSYNQCRAQASPEPGPFSPPRKVQKTDASSTEQKPSSSLRGRGTLSAAPATRVSRGGSSSSSPAKRCSPRKTHRRNEPGERTQFKIAEDQETHCDSAVQSMHIQSIRHIKTRCKGTVECRLSDAHRGHGLHAAHDIPAGHPLAVMSAGRVCQGPAPVHAVRVGEQRYQQYEDPDRVREKLTSAALHAGGMQVADILSTAGGLANEADDCNEVNALIVTVPPPAHGRPAARKNPVTVLVACTDIQQGAEILTDYGQCDEGERWSHRERAQRSGVGYESGYLHPH